MRASAAIPARAAALVVAIRVELAANLAQQEDADNYNTELVAKFREMAADGATGG